MQPLPFQANKPSMHWSIIRDWKRGESSLYRMQDVTPFSYHVPDVKPEQSGSGGMASASVQTAILDDREQT